MSWTDPAAANSPTVLTRTVRGVVRHGAAGRVAAGLARRL